MNISKLEKKILTEYDCNKIDTKPSTENELLVCYYEYTSNLYKYVRFIEKNYFLHGISNEIRAMMGHLADYRNKKETNSKRNLEKAYGHFRRANLDLLKLLCNQMDKIYFRKMQWQYKFDYRKVCNTYLLEFSQKYICAKQKYEVAQKEENLGTDSGVHNIFELYYNAGTEYISLKQFCDQNEKQIRRVQVGEILKGVVVSSSGCFGIIVAILQILG